MGLAIKHLFNTLFHGLLKVLYNGGKLAGSKALVAGWTGGITFLEPVQCLVNWFITIGAIQGDPCLCMHFDLFLLVVCI
jgi:hypothetical protein